MRQRLTLSTGPNTVGPNKCMMDIQAGRESWLAWKNAGREWFIQALGLLWNIGHLKAMKPKQEVASASYDFLSTHHLVALIHSAN